MLFTSSMFRRDSVVDPASAAVSATIVFWTTLIRRDSTDESQPSSGTVAKYTGAISQCTLKAYTTTKTTPTSVWNTTLMAAVTSFSTSVRTFWSFPRVSPLRWSSKSW